MRFARFIEKDNKMVLKAVKLEIRKQNRIDDNNATVVRTLEQDRNQSRERITNQKDLIPVNTTISPQPGRRDDTPSGTITPQDDRSSSRDQGKNGRD